MKPNKPAAPKVYAFKAMLENPERGMDAAFVFKQEAEHVGLKSYQAMKELPAQDDQLMKAVLHGLRNRRLETSFKFQLRMKLHLLLKHNNRIHFYRLVKAQ